MVVFSPSRAKGKRPVSISYITTPKANEIRLGPQRQVVDLLWRHVAVAAGSNSRQGAERRGFLQRLRQTKIHDHGLARTVSRQAEHDVLTLEISVQHASVVNGGEADQQLPRDAEHLGQRRQAVPQAVPKGVPLEILHADEVRGAPVGFTIFVHAGVVQSTDVRMRDAARHARLVQ